MPSRIGFEFDPFELAGVAAPEKKAEALQEIAKFVATQVIEYCGDGKSPVAGGEWKRTLSKDYKAKKTAQGGNSYSDMILSGGMLSALDCIVKGSNLDLRVSGSEQAAKADGHNNFSGKSDLPLREFIPKEGGTFKREIIAGIREIAARYAEGG